MTARLTAAARRREMGGGKEGGAAEEEEEEGTRPRHRPSHSGPRPRHPRAAAPPHARGPRPGQPPAPAPPAGRSCATTAPLRPGCGAAEAGGRRGPCGRRSLVEPAPCRAGGRVCSPGSRCPNPPTYSSSEDGAWLWICYLFLQPSLPPPPVPI